MSHVQPSNHRFRRLHVVRLARRRARRELLQLRPPQSRAVGLRAAAAKPRQRSRLRARSSSGACGALYVVSLLLSGSAHGMGGGLFGFLAPESAELFLLGASGGDAGLRLRPLVDDAQRGLAARQPAAHRLQHDVGARPRARRSPTCSARAAWSSSTPSPASRGFLLSSVRVRVPAATCRSCAARA